MYILENTKFLSKHLTCMSQRTNKRRTKYTQSKQRKEITKVRVGIKEIETRKKKSMKVRADFLKR